MKRVEEREGDVRKEEGSGGNKRKRREEKEEKIGAARKEVKGTGEKGGMRRKLEGNEGREIGSGERGTKYTIFGGKKRK